MFAHGRRRSFLVACTAFSLLAPTASVAHASGGRLADGPPSCATRGDDSTVDERSAQSIAVSWTGVFRGSLVSSGVQVPATTELRERDGEISGRYSFADKSGNMEGTLSHCVRLRVRAIRCMWQDSYGAGDLELMLSKDGTMIAGRWRAANDGPWYDWNGMR